MDFEPLDGDQTMAAEDVEPQWHPPLAADAGPPPFEGAAQDAMADPDAAAEVMAHYAEVSDAQRVDEALAVANKNLSRSWGDWVVFEGEASGALSAITGLPPELRAKALAQLDDDKVTTLIDNMPESEKAAGLKVLFESTSDPKRKLDLWKEYHLADVKGDVAALKASADTGIPGFRSDAQVDATLRQDKRDKAAMGTQVEVAREVAFLEKKRQAGALTAEDVAELAERKDLEHELEMKYSVNLVNEDERRRDGSPVVWTADELRAIDGSMAQLPKSQVAGSTELEKIERRKKYPSEKRVAADTDAKNKSIYVYDFAKEGVGVGENLTHELGHTRANAQGTNYENLVKAAGWKGQTEQSLQDAKLDPEEIKKLRDARVKEKFASVNRDGKLYENSQYIDPQYWSMDEGAMPSPQESADATDGSDQWWYARTDARDQFAEMYRMSVHHPDQLYDDMVRRPREEAARMDGGAGQLQQVAEELRRQGASESDIQQAMKEAGEGRANADRAAAARDQRALERNIIRNDALGTQTEVDAAERRLRAGGATDDAIAKFKQAAEELAGAPAHVGELEKSFRR